MLHAGLAAIACALLYWTLKGMTRRPRPFRQDGSIQLRVPPIDEFSFPSGHTSQAVAISLVAISWFPVLAWLLIPFTLLAAVSRVILGLHYPSDPGSAITNAGLNTTSRTTIRRHLAAVWQYQ